MLLAAASREVSYTADKESADGERLYQRLGKTPKVAERQPLCRAGKEAS